MDPYQDFPHKIVPLWTHATCHLCVLDGGELTSSILLWRLIPMIIILVLLTFLLYDTFVPLFYC